MAGSLLQWQSGRVVPKIFSIWPFQKEFAANTEVEAVQFKVSSSTEGLCDTFQVLG